MFGMVSGTNIVGEDIVASFGTLFGEKEIIYDEAVGDSPLKFLNAVANKPLGSLIIYGRTSNGKSVGDTGTIPVTITGSDLLNPISDKYQPEGSTIIFYGSQRSGHKGYKLRANVTYTFSFEVMYGDDIPAYPAFIDWETGEMYITGEGTTRVLSYTPDKDITVNIMINPDDYIEVANARLDIGNTVNPSGRYHPIQTIDIPTQSGYGLKGEMVSSGGNYVDSSGQRWNCDEINFGEGKYIKRVGVTGNPLETELESSIMDAYKKLISNEGINYITVFSGSVNSGIKVLYEGPLSLE